MFPAGRLDEPERLLSRYGRVLRKRLWLIVAIFCSIVVTVLFDTVKTLPLYQATARLLIEQESSDIISFEEAVGRHQVVDPAVSYSSYYQTQYEILQSRSLARRVIQTLQLGSHPEFIATRQTPGILATARSLPASLLSTLLHSLRQPQDTTGSGTAPAPVLPATDPETALTDQFLARLQVQPIPDTRLVQISFTAHDPRLAAEVANTLARIYIDQHLEMRFAASQEAVDWLNRRVQDMRHKVEAAELALQRYKEASDIISLEERQNVVVQQLAELNSALTKANTEFLGVETLYKGVQRVAQRPELIESLPAVVSNSFIQSLKENYATLQQNAAELEEKWGPKHPGIVHIRAQIEATQKKLRAELDKVVHGIATDYEVAKARLASLRQAFEHKKQEAQDLNKKSIQYGVLKREVESNKQVYDVLLTNLKKTGISAELKRNNLRLIDPAEVPRGPIAPRPLSALTRASLVALLLGIGLALLLESLDTTIKTSEDAERLLQLPVLGVVGRFRLKRGRRHDPGAGMVTVLDPRSQATEAFKALRTTLLMHAAERLPHVWLVTSPHPQDGKTTVAANLAVVMAQMGRRVLLVDADLRYPKLHNIFGYNASPGLSTCLQHDNIADSVIAPVLEPTLSLMPAGPCPPNPSELLGSEGMRRFIDLARACYDVVILDTPPLLAVSDALVASDLVDGVLLVLRSGATPRQHARRVLAQFAALHARTAMGNGGPEHGSASGKILGVVLNFLAPRQDNAYYADYRYYYARPAEATAVVALPPAAR